VITATIERPRPAYLLPDLAEHPALNRPIYRYDHGNKRWYCAVNGDEPQWAVSVTSLIHATRPTSEHLMAWRANLGNDGYHQVLAEKSAYGTWMHILWTRALITGKYTLDEDYLRAQLQDCPTGLENEWVDAGQSDLLALAAWAAERQPEVLAIEPVMLHAINGWYGGALDLVCRLDWNRVRVVAIVDFKSGRKGFYENHEIQLHTYKGIWNSYFAGTEYEVTHVFNLAPNDWKTKPGCKFVNQTDKETREIIPHMLQMFLADSQCRLKPPDVTRYRGTHTLGEPVDGKAETITPLEIIKERMGF